MLNEYLYRVSGFAYELKIGTIDDEIGMRGNVAATSFDG